MRNLLLALASVSTLTTAAAAGDLTYSPPAQGSDFYAPASAVQAHVDLYGGASFLSGDGSDETSNLGVFGGAGRANMPLHDGWNVQIDAQSLAILQHEDDQFYSSPTEFSGYAHLYKMEPASHALGVFGGASWLNGPQVYTAGLEGQMYWQRFTLYGQASASALKISDISGSAVQVRGQGQWFLNDNTGIFGDVIWTGIDLDESANDLTLVGTLMHRFEGTPIAGFAKVRWDQASGDGDTVTATTVLAGVRIIADPPGGTLRSSLMGVPMDVEPIQFGMFGVEN
jgi:opacity protein-like surface antigen